MTCPKNKGPGSDNSPEPTKATPAAPSTLANMNDKRDPHSSHHLDDRRVYFVMPEGPVATSKGMRAVSLAEAIRLNSPEHCNGVFHTVNAFRGTKRTKDELTAINAWFVDIDEGDKADMLARIYAAPIEPSIIVETRRGYHVYYIAIGESNVGGK